MVNSNNCDILLGIYRHYKDNAYEVVGFAKHSETLEDMKECESHAKETT